MTEDSKFLGVGEAQYHTNLKKLIKEGKVYKGLDYFSAPHSQYFNSLSEQGIIGLLSLFLMMLIPLRIVIIGLIENRQAKSTGLFVAVLIVSYLDFMLTQETLERQLMVVIYAFISSILLGMYRKKTELIDRQ
jgi:O-antigen ligase